MITSEWTRVTRANKCPICEHDSWCSIGEKWIACMRVASDKPCSSGGYFHAINGERIDPIIIKRKPKPVVHTDFGKLMQTRMSYIPNGMFDAFVNELGVTARSLQTLGIAWSPYFYSWAFPMHNAEGDVVGVRLRTPSGQKFAIKGSHQGLFIPVMLPRTELWVLEGPTDTAAALSLDLFAIGKPSCLGCEDEIVKFIQLNRIKRVVICADADKPGQDGAEKLQGMMQVPSVIYTPPAKDFREAVKLGLTKEILTSTIANMVWTQPKNQ